MGWKNSGKTTLVERLVAEITERGLSVSTVKHAHHAFDVDKRGTDSHRHRAAGAAQTIVSSARRWALISELRGRPETDLEELLTLMAPVDLVLVEGYKSASHPKIEVRGLSGETARPIAAFDPGVEAIATRMPFVHPGLPVFDQDDVPGIAGFILSRTGVR